MKNQLHVSWMTQVLPIGLFLSCQDHSKRFYDTILSALMRHLLFPSDRFLFGSRATGNKWDQMLYVFNTSHPTPNPDKDDTNWLTSWNWLGQSMFLLALYDLSVYANELVLRRLLSQSSYPALYLIMHFLKWSMWVWYFCGLIAPWWPLRPA